MSYFKHAELAAKRKKKYKKRADDPCWEGYKQIGMKTKDGHEVPNCVPEETAAETFKPPAGVAAQAKRGMKLRKEGGNKAATSVGVKRASQLAGRQNLSLATVKRMKAYFDRHQIDKKGKDWGNKEKPSKGKIAWLLWGGDPGYAWAKKIVAANSK